MTFSGMCKSTLFVLSACLFLASPAMAALPPGISGAWYNPAQSGHGLSVEIIAPDRALVFWYAYDLEGNPFNLYIDGRIQGRRIDAVGLAPRGMRFGSFDPTQLTLAQWGSLRIEFEDCNTGKLSWQANDPAFGSGSTDLIRLTGIHGETCDIGDPSVAVSDVYVASITARTSAGVSRGSFGVAAVDREGRMWGLERLQTSDAIPGFIPYFYHPRIVIAQLAGGEQQLGASVVRDAGNYWSHSWAPGVAPVRGDWVSGERSLTFPDAAGQPVTWALRRSVSTMVRPLTGQQLARDRIMQVSNYLGPVAYRITLTEEGGVCVASRMPPTSACMLDGRYWLTDAEAGFFDFELHRTPEARPSQVAYRGRGWLQTDAQGEALIMVGDDGHAGLGLISR